MVNVGMDLLLCKLNAYGTNKYGKMGYIYNTNHLSNRNPNIIYAFSSGISLNIQNFCY